MRAACDIGAASLRGVEYSRSRDRNGSPKRTTRTPAGTAAGWPRPRGRLRWPFEGGRSASIFQRTGPNDAPDCVYGILSCVWFAAAPARAEHAKITLEVSTAQGQETAFVDQTPPASGKNPRPLVRAKVNEPVKVQYVLTNIYPHKTLEDVVVHFFVVPQKKAGQKEVPAVGDDAVIETAFDMTFKPGSKAGQKSTFRVEKPGAYLVRVETRQTKSDHEHFSAVDLVVEGEKAP